MSFAEAREALAAAVSTVPGITGYPKRPAVLNPGDAWPLLARAARGPGNAYEFEWRVLVLVGRGESDAIDQTEAWLPPLLEALDPVAYVDTAAPFAIATSGGDLF